MSEKTIRVPEWFHDHVRSFKREDETMSDALIRMYGGPHPEHVAGFLSDETAEEMKEAIDSRSEADAEKRREIVERMDDSG